MNNSRGQSTVEFALALLALVPIILYSIYVGELFAVSAKAQEAEIAAAYDMSAYRYHDYANPGGSMAIQNSVDSRYSQVAAQVSLQVARELNDLNSFTPTGPSRIRLVTGEAGFVGGGAVQCTPRRLERRFRAGAGFFGTQADELLPFSGFEFTADPAFAQSGPLAQEARAMLSNDWMVTCASRVEHVPLWIPKTWAQEFTHKNDNSTMVNPISAPLVFGGIGGSLNGQMSGTLPALGMPLVVDDWAVETPNRRGLEEVAAVDSDSANPTYFKANERVHMMHGPYWAEENLRETTVWMMGAETLEGKQGFSGNYQGKLDALKLGLADSFGARRRFQGTGNVDWYQLPHNDGEKGISSLEDVASKRAAGTYLGHPNPSFNQP